MDANTVTLAWPVAPSRPAVLTAGAPPPSIIFKKMEALGFEVMHVYGLTETYGHILQCAWNDEWNSYDEDKKILKYVFNR